MCVQAFTAVNVHMMCVGVSSEGGEQYITHVNLISNALKIIIFLTLHHYGPKFTNLMFHFFALILSFGNRNINSYAVNNPMELCLS
jgi:hypothetical protein